MPPPALADYQTRAELAAELGVHQRTLWRWHQLGTAPPCIHMGRRPLYPRAGVAAWLASKQEGGE